VVRYSVSFFSFSNDFCLGKLFEMLETFAGRPIGKRFGLDAFYRSKQDIIKAAIDRSST